MLYEFPFNERIRTYLRLEHLLRRLSVLVPREQPIDHHYALATMFEIIEVSARSDLKTDLLKDLERHKQILNGYRDNPHIAQSVLDGIIAQLDACFASLHEQHSKAGQELIEHEWLSSLRSRFTMPGGTCEFDLPVYHAWQHLPPTRRIADLERWAQSFAPLAEPVYMLLRLLRDASGWQKVAAVGGVFQQNLPQGRTFQLLRLRIDPSRGLVPEMSGNRLLASVRFLEPGENGRLAQWPGDVNFEVALS
ncbi:MAG: Cell division protein ZapD [Paracidovorax wautersii]|uniref:Cell division protein ZapD n=1 Tax=Paracidovorax wautersii TaxID=1177982 RepID=A0A7V8JR67_9BURK|nr:MAG: Cell division protein ZapD [Paracidovorax wautersii]